MKDSVALSMSALLESIGQIGIQSKDSEFNSKKIIEKLKKTRAELIQETYDSAFSPDNKI